MTIISKTKYEASAEEIKKLFSFHKLGNVVDIVALGCGEFNAAYIKSPVTMAFPTH